MSQSNFGFSEIECKIILDQIERRARYRREFLRLKSDPCKNSMEAGYVVSNKNLDSLRNSPVLFASFAVKLLDCGVLHLMTRFDPAMQRFLSMKVSQLEHFQVNGRTIRAGVFMVLLPLAVYGYAIWSTRQERERQIRCGMIKYKDRILKFC